MANDKKKLQRPKPSILGSGMAYQAGKMLKKRRENMEAFEEELFGPSGMKNNKKKLQKPTK